MPDRARVTHPNARVMLTTGNIRVPVLPVATNPTAGWTEFAPGVWEVEVIPDPDPDWQPGEVVQDTDGHVFVFTPAGRLRHVLGQDIHPNRPLVRLVPEA